MAQCRLSWMQSLRLRELSEKGKQGSLTAAEEAEMNALLLLKERGQDVESCLMLGA